ncbi:hypothetical protein TNCV_4826981 [Trichonephila clavipes]|nr:hypothetical protein TNCV_4826981 [Trichonephila clavipes]
MTEEQKHYVSEMKEFHGHPSEVIRVMLVFLSVQKQSGVDLQITRYAASIIELFLCKKDNVITILEPKLLPSIRNLFTNHASFIFQQVSAPFHTVK